MSEESSPQDVIAVAIASTGPSMARDIESEGVMCTEWVSVAGWTDAEGRWWMTTTRSRDAPAWRIRGLLAEAIADLDQGEDEG